MKKIETFEDAKQAVAEKRNTEDWECMMAMYEGVEAFMPEGWLKETIEGANTEAAELYMRHAVNEAVKADRSDALKELYYDRHFDYTVVRTSDITDRPLPFPQQSDER